MRQRLDRRGFLRCTAGGGASLVLSALSLAEERNVRVTTYTYKKVGKLEIRADVHRPNDEVTRPVVVWIHGRALISGYRGWVNPRVKEMMLEAGYMIVSIDYRRPVVLVSFWGYGDLVGDWLQPAQPTSPSPPNQGEQGRSLSAGKRPADLRFPRPQGKQQHLLPILSAARIVAEGGVGLGPAQRGGEVRTLLAGAKCDERLSAHDVDSWD